MSASEKPTCLADRLRRLLALGCAAMVFALTIFAASPEAHGYLHAHQDCPSHDHATSEPDHSCAVVLFASGVSLPVGPLFVTPPTTVPAGISPVTAAEVFLVSPRYLRQPERGPPLSWVG
ncbi:MAG: hypothetical protein JNL92_02640 [Opitutaceae bacterium]|nr:hypothetical protein [Opitutaceae bacterium]